MDKKSKKRKSMLNLKEKNSIDVITKNKNYFGSLKGIGSFNKEDKARGQLD